MPYAANDPQAQARNAAFLQGLQQLGWTVGTNVQIDYRWSAGNENDTRKYAAELVALAPDVIFASGSAAVGPLRRAGASSSHSRSHHNGRYWPLGRNSVRVAVVRSRVAAG